MVVPCLRLSVWTVTRFSAPTPTGTMVLSTSQLLSQMKPSNAQNELAAYSAVCFTPMEVPMTQILTKNETVAFTLVSSTRRRKKKHSRLGFKNPRSTACS